MHLLIPFAGPPPAVRGDGPAGAPLAAAAAPALDWPALPHLGGLLARWRVVDRDDGDERDWSPPHERALARALGLPGDAGRIPWAAHAARADGIDPGTLAWALLTPAHWHLGTEQVSLADPAALDLPADESRAFLDSVRDLFEGDGCVLRFGAPLRWYAAHPSFAGLATASPDRVVGRNVDAWLGADPAARLLRRLQSEVQMRWHEHPLNAARQARGVLPVNSFWASGCGSAPPGAASPGGAPQVDERLRAPALAGDRAAWFAAWQALDAGPVARWLKAAGDRDGGAAGTAAPPTLTLCGERSAVQLQPWPADGRAGAVLQRLRGWWAATTGSPAGVPALLESL